MTDDTLDALFEDKSTPAAQPEPTPAAEPAPQAQPEPQAQPRDETGRFAAKVETPVPAQATPAAPVAQPQTKPSIDPDQFKGYLDEREKRQAAQKEAETLRARLAERERQQQPIPDPVTDPDGYNALQQKRLWEVENNMRFSMSERFAVQTYGSDLVQAAKAWGDERADDPRTGRPFAQMFVMQDDPISWIVEQYKQNQHWSAAGKDPDAWAKARYAELTAAQPQQPAPQAQQPASPQSAPAAPLPTPSLASAVSAAGAQHVPEASLGDIFKR